MHPQMLPEVISSIEVKIRVIKNLSKSIITNIMVAHIIISSSYYWGSA